MTDYRRTGHRTPPKIASIILDGSGQIRSRTIADLPFTGLAGIRTGLRRGRSFGRGAGQLPVRTRAAGCSFASHGDVCLSNAGVAGCVIARLCRQAAQRSPPAERQGNRQLDMRAGRRSTLLKLVKAGIAEQGTRRKLKDCGPAGSTPAGIRDRTRANATMRSRVDQIAHPRYAVDGNRQLIGLRSRIRGRRHKWAWLAGAASAPDGRSNRGRERNDLARRLICRQTRCRTLMECSGWWQHHRCLSVYRNHPVSEELKSPLRATVAEAVTCLANRQVINGAIAIPVKLGLILWPSVRHRWLPLPGHREHTGRWTRISQNAELNQRTIRCRCWLGHWNMGARANCS